MFKFEKVLSLSLIFILLITLFAGGTALATSGDAGESGGTPEGKPVTGLDSGFGEEFAELYAELEGKTGQDAYDFFDSLKSRGLNDHQILRFFIHLPLSHANEQAANIYEQDGLEAYSQFYPYGEAYNNYTWQPGSGTDIVAPFTGVNLRLPFTDYLPMEADTIGDPSTTYNVGVVSAGSVHPWSSTVADAFLWQLQQLSNVNINFQEHLGDDSKLSSIMDTFIAQNVDAILVHPRSEAGSGPAVRRALAADIPVIAVDTLTGSEDITVQVAGNFPANGVQNAMFLLDQLHNEGSLEANMIFLRKPLGATNDALRTGHFLKVISYFPEIKILQSYFDKNSKTEAFDNAQAALMAYPEIDVFLNLGDHEALAAYEAITMADRMYSREGGKKIIMLCHNDSREVMKMVGEGNFECTAPSTPLIGDIGARALAMVLAGQEVPQYLVLPNIPLITLDGRTLFGMQTQAVDDWKAYGYGPEV